MAKKKKKTVTRTTHNQQNRTRGSRPAPTAAAKKKQRGAAVGNDALAKKIAATKQLVVEADRHNVADYYKVAVECREIIDGDGKDKTYGAGAAARLCKALGWSRSIVYAHVAVTKVWNADKFEQLIAQQAKANKPLSWSHYLVLAAEKDAQQRRALTKQALDEGWSVRDLRQAIAGKPPKVAKTAGADEPPAPRPLVNAIANYATGLTTAKSNAGVFGEEIQKQVENAKPSDLNSGLLESVKKALAELEIHYQTESQRLKTLIQLIKSGKQAPSDSTAVAEAEGAAVTTARGEAPEDDGGSSEITVGKDQQPTVRRRRRPGMHGNSQLTLADTRRSQGSRT